MAGNDTYAGALEVLMKQIASMKMVADANLPFIIELETMVLQEIRSPERQMQAAGILPPAGGGPGAGPMPGAMPGNGMPMGPPPGASPPPSFLGAGIPGAGPQQSPPPANPDELRRVMNPV